MKWFSIKLIGPLLFYLLFSNAIWPIMNSKLNSSNIIVLDSCKYKHIPSKRGYNPEYIFFSKENKYFIENQTIEFTDGEYIEKRLNFPTIAKIEYRRRWFWLFGNRIILQMKHMDYELVDENRYKKDFGLIFYLQFLGVIYIVVILLINIHSVLKSKAISVCGRK